MYSIKDLENFSGIKAHTIRIWEQRYHLLHPVRTETGIRTYCDNDLKRILNIATLQNKGGIKISKIAELTDSEVLEKILQLSSSDFDEDSARLKYDVATLKEANANTRYCFFARKLARAVNGSR